MKDTSDDNEARWSKWLESVRKDVECTFASLKIDSDAINHQYPIIQKNIDNVSSTCCLVHIMLLSNDGFDRRCEDGCNWQRQYGNHANEDLAIMKISYENHHC